MYNIGDKFTTNYDNSTWEITSLTFVINDDGMSIVPGYVINATTYNDDFSISHDTVEKGVYIKKLIEV